MYAGEFYPLQDPIKFSDEGKFMDGHHRLSALSKTDLSFDFLVVRGFPKDYFVYMDQNRPRTNTDTLVVLGEANAAYLAARE